MAYTCCIDCKKILDIKNSFIYWFKFNAAESYNYEKKEEISIDQI